MGFYLGNYEGNDADAIAGIGLEKHLGLIEGRMGEIRGEYDQRGQFMEDASALERQGITRQMGSANRQAGQAVGQAMGRTGGFAGSGQLDTAVSTVQDEASTTRAGFFNQLKGNTLSLMRDRFNLGVQEKADIFGIQTSALDLYSSYHANLEKSESDVGFDYERFGIDNG